jgi:voltage-gated potassium channel Kch
MWAVILWLGAITLAAALLSSLLLSLFGVTLAGSESGAWFEESWQSLLRILDSGTMAADVGWGRRLLSLLVTIFGILIAGTLIGLIASGVEQRVEAMRRGRSTVVESGHVIVLGASPRLPEVIDQLTLANRGRKAGAIVVLADAEPSELADAVRGDVPDSRGTRVVYRHGDPSRRSDLSIVGLDTARAVVILGDGEDGGDARVVRAVLAVGAEMGGFGKIPIVADVASAGTAESLAAACGRGVHPVVASQTVARTMAFALREPGLSQVVGELLDLRGSDLHIRELGDLAGETFGEAVFGVANARPIGRMCPDGTVEINPPPATVLAKGDRLVVLADDASVPKLSAWIEHVPAVAPHAAETRRSDEKREEHLLLVGWNGLGPRLLAELDGFCAPGSTCNLVYDARLIDPDDLEIPSTAQLRVTAVPSNSSASMLELASAPTTTAIVLLGYRGRMSPTEADSRTLLDLMMLQGTSRSRGGAMPRLIVELANRDSVELIEATGADDYVVSDGVASRIIVQLAEQPERRDVLLTLYGPEGPSVRLVPAPQLGLHGEVGCDEIIATAFALGWLAIGWRRTEGGAEVRLNPKTSDRVVLGDEDHIIVIG